MKLNLNELKLAMNIIHRQITNRLLENENSKLKLGLDAISDLSMSYVDGILSIEGPLEEEINPKYPKMSSIFSKPVPPNILLYIEFS